MSDMSELFSINNSGCYFGVDVKKEDALKFKDIIGVSEWDEESEHNGVVFLIDHDAPGGHYGALARFFGEGILFTGYHESSSSCDAYAFACDGKQVFYAQTTRDGYYCIATDVMGDIIESSRQQVKDYVTADAIVHAYFNEVDFPGTLIESANIKQPTLLVE